MKSVIYKLIIFGAPRSVIKYFNEDKSFIMDLKVDTCQITMINCLVDGTDIYLACLVDNDPDIILLKKEVISHIKSYLSAQHDLMLSTHTKECCDNIFKHVGLLTNNSSAFEEIPLTRELFRWIFLS